ncbi:MAG: hypothetical protein AAF439_03975, partial [Pseudomonadota bacterium]
ADPVIRCFGAPKDGDGWVAPLEEMIAAEVDAAIDGAPRKERAHDEGVELLATRAVRRVTGRHWGKKPVVSVMVTRLEEDD